MYMLGRRRTCSRPSRTWICSAVYATSAPRDLGLGSRSGSGFLTAITGTPSAYQTGDLALPAWRTHRGQLGRTSGYEFYRILNTKMAGRPVLTGLFGRVRGGGLPAQDGVLALALQVGVDPARRGHLVEPSDGQVFRLVVEGLGVGPGLGDDLLDRLGKRVQRRLALGLGGLDHDRFRHHQREVDRRGVELAVEERLGDVERPHAVLVKVVRAGHELVHAGTRVGHLEVGLDELAQVVGGKHR